MTDEASGEGQFINDLINHPSFERIRSEILHNGDKRAQEAAQAFAGLMTFCGILYSGATVAIMGYMGARASLGVPYLSIVAFCFFSAALVAFAILYQFHSQLYASRSAYYASAADGFFHRRVSLEQPIQANSKFQTAWLYRAIFWVPLCFAICGFVFGSLGVLGIGASTAPILKITANLLLAFA